MSKPTVIFATFLAPALYKTYQHIVEYIEEALSIPTFLIPGESLDDFAYGSIDAGFICGLVYTRLSQQIPSPVELVAAPILKGERYQQSPLYFSDIVVRKDSPANMLADLYGCTWAYNEKASHSGYNLVQYSLLEQGKSLEQFAQTVETGSHAQSLRLILEGKADAAAIDSYMLDVILRNRPEIAEAVRIIGSFGPSTIPPVVASTRLPRPLRKKIRETFLTMHQDRLFAQRLDDGLIERFVPITDEHYHNIRTMHKKVQIEVV
ncbi:MAG TPA: PhnD/SsuA/transferrin family substrate-binding protein [Ktedonobacteraceae bacterium]